MIRKVEPAEALSSIFDDNVKAMDVKDSTRKSVHDSFQSIFDVELGKVGLTMEDVHRIQGR